MPLSCWFYSLGLICLLPGLSVTLAPSASARLFNAFPRNKVAGMVISALAWGWAGYALWTMGLDILVPFKRVIPVAVLVCIPLTWFWLGNLLPCRAFGAVLVLFPYELLHVARVHPSGWRLVAVGFAYICIVKGMVLLLYPWKMRQMIVWVTQRPVLFRVAGALDVLAGLVLIGIGAVAVR